MKWMESSLRVENPNKEKCRGNFTKAKEKGHTHTHTEEKKNEISLEWLVGPLCIVLIRIRIHINVSYLLCSYLSK